MLRIGNALGPGDPFWVQVIEAASQRASESNVSHVPLPTPSEHPLADEQLSFCEMVRALELDALIAHALPHSLAMPILESGLPMVFADDTDLRHPLLVSPSSMRTAALLAGKFITDRIEGGGHVLMIGGLLAQLCTTRMRVEGFLDTLRPYPNLRCTQIRTLWRYEEVYDQIMEEADVWRTYFADGPAVAIFGLSDPLALAGRDVGRRLGFVDDNTLIVGINGDPLAIAAIVDGSMHATVDTGQQEMGRNLVDYAIRLARREPASDHYFYRMELVTAQNAPQVAARKLVEIADLPSRLVDVNRRQEEMRLQQMTTSLQINRQMGAILDTDQLLREMATLISERYAFDAFKLYRWNEEEKSLCCDDPGAPPEFANIPLAPATPLGYALLSNRPVYLPDTGNSQRFALDPGCLQAHSRVLLPMRVGGRIQGILDLQSARRRMCTQVELDALQTLADQLAVAIQNAQLYAQALAAKAEAERANLLRRRLLSNVSHELRAPLNTILGYCQTAISESGPYDQPVPAELVGDLRHIQRSGQHLVRLVDDLLSLSLAEIGALEIVCNPVDSTDLLSEIFQSLAGSSAKQSIEWRIELPAALPPINADPVRLRQVLLNILSNAERFTECGHILLRATVDAGYLHIWIEDTGVGIPLSLQKRINAALTAWEEPGDESGDPRPTGVGLGLAVAAHIVNLHNGALHLDSQPGHGTVCHIQLPLNAQTMESSAAVTPVVTLAGPEAQERALANLLHHASEIARETARYISEHYAAPITRDDIAASLQVSADHVSRVFRKETGMSPWQFLNHYRIMQAQRLLLETDLSVTEVGGRVGFNDPAYFVRIFHRETGRSPQQYRKSAKQAAFVQFRAGMLQDSAAKDS